MNTCKYIYAFYILILLSSCEKKDVDSIEKINKNSIKDLIEAMNNKFQYKVEYKNKIWNEYIEKFNKIGAIDTKEKLKEVNVFIEKYPNFIPAKINKLYYYGNSENGSDEEFEKHIKSLNPNDSLKSIISVLKAFRNKENYYEAMNLIDSAIEKFPHIQSFYFIKTVIEPDYNKKFLIYDEALKKDSLKLLPLYCLDATYAEDYKKIITLLYDIENKKISKEEYSHYLSFRAESYEKLNDLVNAEQDYLKMIELEKEKNMMLIAFYKRNNYSKTQILEKIKGLIKNHNYKLEYFDEYKDDKELLKMLDKK